ncbi:uncharacterized protein LOC124112069 [Haliotis rufescens]|uniref:uncharacterized protein LOC124112069 n=1 Tax=Haliotis rufescens TaxID=6454 RepID=UPI00201F3EDE|nr:uncharacterized protein LOC124112069 [Haliotis rufescens]
MQNQNLKLIPVVLNYRKPSAVTPQFNPKLIHLYIDHGKKLLDATINTIEDPDGAASINGTDVEKAELQLYRQAQEECLPDEMKALSKGLRIASNSRLSQLSPEYDKDHHVIRVGGRLRRCDELSIDVKHPIVLDPNHNVTKLLIKKYDSDLHHYGAERLHGEIRRKFWILRGCEAIKKHQRQCHDCQKWRANPEIPLMADLPEARLRLFKPPFYSTGIDCFGPMYIKIGRHREKRYGIIFKCMTTRAVHIDILDSLDTDAFLMALRRFISRRGCPFELLSDCGTNFKGGENELCKAFEAMNSELKEKLAKNHIRFQFNPPFAPHFGGLWEREIRSIKYGLRSILGTESVSESVLRTVMTEVESILNSKPLGYTSSDISDTDPVTPYTLLIGRSDPALPQVVYLNEDRLTKKRFRQSQVLADHFWRKFIKEYLPNLQPRVKWTDERRNVQTDDVVLIIDPLHTRSEWKIGQVIETYAGSDGRVR